MSKTFSNEGRDLTIEKSDFGGVKFRVESNVRHANGAIASVADAPAIALAILEAAGWPEDDVNSTSRTICNDLQFVLQVAEQKAARAREAAEWDALERRRGELAVEYFEGAYGHLQRSAYRRAIDRIIELESGGTK